MEYGIKDKEAYKVSVCCIIELTTLYVVYHLMFFILIKM